MTVDRARNQRLEKMPMNKFMRWLIALASAALLSGCATKMRSAGGEMAAMAPIMPPSAGLSGTTEGNMAEVEVQPDRMLIWKADLNIKVWNVSNAVSKAVTLTERQGGYVEKKSDHGDASAHVTLRIPAKSLKAAVATLESLGTVTYRNVEGDDVTEQYIDIEARLKNKIVLRDRLKQLLAKASDVKDVLAIEVELNRIQGDIDSMEARIKSIKGQVDYATVTLSLERKPVLGPLGYLLKGCGWVIQKLFVIRD
jgi:hypothetical protein